MPTGTRSQIRSGASLFIERGCLPQRADADGPCPCPGKRARIVAPLRLVHKPSLRYLIAKFVGVHRMRKVIDLECDLPPDENGHPRKVEALSTHPPGYGDPERLPPLPGHGFS